MAEYTVLVLIPVQGYSPAETLIRYEAESPEQAMEEARKESLPGEVVKQAWLRGRNNG